MVPRGSKASTALQTQEPTKIVTHVSLTPKGLFRHLAYSSLPSTEWETGQTRLTLHHNRQYRNNEAQTRRHPADTETRKSDFQGPPRGGDRTPAPLCRVVVSELLSCPAAAVAVAAVLGSNRPPKLGPDGLLERYSQEFLSSSGPHDKSTSGLQWVWFA